jgi:hypothetical protein
MEMLYIIGLSLLALALIDQQHTAMRRAVKARIKESERRDR